MSDPNQPPSYPAIKFLAAKGDLLAILVALVPICVGLWALAAGYPLYWMIAALVVAGVLWLILRSYVEVLRVLSDTLMPR